MAGGKYDKLAGKTRPGTYINFESDRNDTVANSERGKLPSNAREGDCIYQDEKGELHIDPEETARRRRHNAALVVPCRNEAHSVWNIV